MSRIIYTAGLLMTGSDDVTVGRDLIVNRHISGSGELFFSASNGGPELRILMYDTGSGKVFMSQSLSDISVAGNPAGSNTEIQFNNGGNFGASSNLTFDGSTLTVTGDVSVTGDLSAKGPNRSIQFNDGGNLSGSSVLGFNKDTDTLQMTGSTILLASEASDLSMEMNESASFEFLTGAANSGSFIVQKSPDVGLGALESYFGQGIGTAAGQSIPNQTFGIKYTSGSSASEGELTMVIGKRDLSNLGGANQNNFYVAYEPGGTFTNAQGELEFFVGEHLNVGSGVLSAFRGGETSLTQTSSFAGYFSASAFANQQRHTRPFALSTSASVDDTNPAFVINKDHTDLTSDNLVIDYGGTIKTDGRLIFRNDIAAEISASGRLDLLAGSQINLRSTSGTGIRSIPGNEGNVATFLVTSQSITGEPGNVLRNISTEFFYAQDGIANVFNTASLFAATALDTETLDYRGDVITGVGTYGTGPNTSPKGAIVALTGSQWGVASSGSGACASSSLAIALTGGDQGPANHYLLNGIVNLPYAPGDRVGQLLYLGDNGSASAVPPTNGAHFSIPVGYYLGGTTMYFSPDRTTGGADNVTATTNTPAGSDTQIQFNDGGAFGASSNFTFDDGALTLTGNFTASNNISASGDIIGSSGSFARLSVSSLAAIGDSQTDTINITGNSLFMLEENNNGTFKIRENATQVDILAIQADDTPRAVFAFDPTHYDNDVDGQGRIGLGIATASIASKLHINLLTGSNAPTSIVRLDATGNDNIMFVSSSGNVGIGTGTPDELLTVAGNVSASGLLFVSASENTGQSAYRVLVQDITTGRVYYTGSYFDTSPYETGTMVGDIQPKLGNNIASGSFSTIAGGQDNIITGSNAFIGAGSGSIIKGGKNNFIAGGQDNIISGSDNNFIAGLSNVITQDDNNAILGSGNTIIGAANYDSNFIAGSGNSLSFGKANVITGAGNTITTEAYYYRIGGLNNTLSSIDNTSNNPGGVFSGKGNTLGDGTVGGLGHGQIIVGGLNNVNAGRLNNSIILTGQENAINDSVQPTIQNTQGFHSILNGLQNQITGSAPTTSAAKDQSGKFSTIVNGESNKIETGGAATQTVYKYNTIVNGVNNVVSGSGSTAGVSGLYNTIVNGSGNIIMPDVSGSTIAAGSNITADRSDTVYAANLSLTNLPTSAAGLPVGAVYRDGTTLKIVV